MASITLKALEDTLTSTLNRIQSYQEQIPAIQKELNVWQQKLNTLLAAMASYNATQVSLVKPHQNILDGKVSVESQQYWADRWEDIYIATQEDEIAYSDRKLKGTVDNAEDYYCFAYESSQGYFELLIPKSDCEVIDTDSTVECLAQYLLEEQKKRTPEGICQVIAYEGVGKGATVKG